MYVQHFPDSLARVTICHEALLEPGVLGAGLQVIPYH